MDEIEFIFNILNEDVSKEYPCLTFIGAGASSEYIDSQNNIVPGLPMGAELAKILADKCNYPFSLNGDLAKVGEYFLYKHCGNRLLLEDVVREAIQKPYRSPRPIHSVLSQLKGVKFIITTNYDHMIEEEAQKYRALTLHYYNRLSSENALFPHSPKLKDDEVVVYKMHGTVEKPETMVITESDYINYLVYIYDRERGIPTFLKEWLPYCNLLFLGYSMEDWDFKIIWEGMLYNYNKLRSLKDSFALVKDMDDSKINYWRKRNINVIKYDLTEFSKVLAARFNLKIPQLNIPQATLGGAI